MLTCARAGCGQPKADHGPAAPHTIVTAFITCAGWTPEHPCGHCGTEGDDHGNVAPYRRDSVSCPGFGFTGAEGSPYEPGGGSSGSGGSSGNW